MKTFLLILFCVTCLFVEYGTLTYATYHVLEASRASLIAMADTLGSYGIVALVGALFVHFSWVLTFAASRFGPDDCTGRDVAHGLAIGFCGLLLFAAGLPFSAYLSSEHYVWVTAEIVASAYGAIVGGVMIALFLGKATHMAGEVAVDFAEDMLDEAWYQLTRKSRALRLKGVRF